ncbi:MAG: type 3 dihydrofolate reductase [Candidatus Microgenomates bacterium]
MISAIAVIGPNRELGESNKLIYVVPGDLPRFKRITMGHPIIMGRKTHESIGRELPGRTNIVLSRSSQINTPERALEVAKKSPGSEEIFVIGGGEIFELFMPYVERLYLTIVETPAPGADTFFPDYAEFAKIVSEEVKEAAGMRFRYVTMER